MSMVLWSGNRSWEPGRVFMRRGLRNCFRRMNRPGNKQTPACGASCPAAWPQKGKVELLGHEVWTAESWSRASQQWEPFFGYYSQSRPLHSEFAPKRRFSAAVAAKFLIWGRFLLRRPDLYMTAAAYVQARRSFQLYTTGCE